MNEPTSGDRHDREDDDGAEDVAQATDSGVASRAAARDAVLIESLGSGASYSEAAELAGCSAKTVGRRMADESFRAAVEAKRLEWAITTAGRISAMGPRAAAVLGRLLDADDDDVCLRAARETLAQGHRALELDKLKKQVSLLQGELKMLNDIVRKRQAS